MWSVGVIAYLLLVGHNPFCDALLKQDPKERDEEVMRLAALGDFNLRSRYWKRLDVLAQNFISGLLQVKASARLSTKEALFHPFLCRTGLEVEPSLSMHAHNEKWTQFDGLQRLAWVAVARAVADPELDVDIINSAMTKKNTADLTENCFDKSGYVYHLARELAMSTINKLLQQQASWNAVLRLAFAYLDVDRDGLLSHHDLMLHLKVDHSEALTEDISGNRIRAAVFGWLEHWTTQQSTNNTQGLNFLSFCEVLLAC